MGGIWLWGADRGFHQLELLDPLLPRCPFHIIPLVHIRLSSSCNQLASEYFFLLLRSALSLFSSRCLFFFILHPPSITPPFSLPSLFQILGVSFFVRFLPGFYQPSPFSQNVQRRSSRAGPGESASDMRSPGLADCSSQFYCHCKPSKAIPIDAFFPPSNPIIPILDPFETSQCCCRRCYSGPGFVQFHLRILGIGQSRLCASAHHSLDHPEYEYQYHDRCPETDHLPFRHRR